MSGCLKKNITCATKSNTKKKCAPKPAKIVSFVSSRNETTGDSKVAKKPSPDLKKGAIKILVPIKKNVKPIVVEKGDIRLTSAYRQRRSFLAALNTSAERDLNLTEAQIDSTKKVPRIKSAQSQSSVALARKKYSYLSRCALKSNSAITNNSTNKQTKNSGLLTTSTKANCEFYKGVSRYAETVKLQMLGTMKSTKGHLKLSGGFVGNNEPKLDPVASHAIRILNRILVKPPMSEIHKDMNPQHLYRLQVPQPKSTIEQLCTKCNFICYNKPREQMPLVVLDLDETLCDFFNEIGGACVRARRPHLDYFLEAIYQFYDIAIWSATNMDTILLKLNFLKMINNINSKYKISFCLDVTSTIITHIPGLGRSITKPLVIIWELFPQYNEKNTLMIDDKPNNFHFNPHQGVTISEYKQNRFTNDIELMELGQYLCKIAYMGQDFSKINHDIWKKRVNAILR